MSSAPIAPTSPSTELDVVCLCAAWCGTCGEYEPLFKALQAALPGHRYRWIDIEDESDLVGDIDVETFPTLLVARRGQVLFAGPVLPRLADAQRLVEAQLERASAVSATDRLIPSGSLPADQVRALETLARALMR